MIMGHQIDEHVFIFRVTSQRLADIRSATAGRIVRDIPSCQQRSPANSGLVETEAHEI
jgi:hypothetical protein